MKLPLLSGNETLARQIKAFLAAECNFKAVPCGILPPGSDLSHFQAVCGAMRHARAVVVASRE